jgi:hypothetical protein
MLALTETETVTALSTGSGVFNSSFSRTTSLFAYRLKGYLICNNRELRLIPRVPWLLPTLLSSLRLGLR